ADAWPHGHDGIRLERMDHGRHRRYGSRSPVLPSCRSRSWPAVAATRDNDRVLSSPTKLDGLAHAPVAGHAACRFAPARYNGGQTTISTQPRAKVRPTTGRPTRA